MKTCKIRNLVLGEGMPKICTPIVEKTEEEIIKSAKKIKRSKIDIVELRADWFDDALNIEKTEKILKKLREIFKEIPILFTFRTAKEGGKKDINKNKYAEMNIKVAQTGLVDAIDIEIFTVEEYIKDIVKEAHKSGVKIVGSNHDFEKTPSREDIINRLKKMQELDVDILKIAFMPKDKKDVKTLISATYEMYTNYANKPIISISMGKIGLISRLMGELYGSSVTFGAVEKTSAPGQINVKDLKKVIEIIHDNM